MKKANKLLLFAGVLSGVAELKAELKGARVELYAINSLTLRSEGRSAIKPAARPLPQTVRPL